MAKKNDKEVQLTADEKLVNKTNGWLSKHGKLLTIIVSAVVAVIVIVSIVTVVVNTSNNKTYEKLDALTAQYSEYTTMDSDAEGYDSAKTALVSDAEALMAKGVKKYPGAKAAMILADLAYEDGDYSKAIELYKKVADGQKKTFLREVALMSMAAALEENGDKNSAKDVYNAFFDEYGLDSLYSSRALFNAARLTEDTDKALAISIYEQLVGEFGDYGSEYAKLAQSRIAQLN